MAEKSIRISPEDILDVKYVSCNICGSNDRETLFSNKFIGGRVFDYACCKRCGLIYVYPMIVMDVKVISRLYSDKLLSDSQKSLLNEDFFSSGYKARKDMFNRLLQSISKYRRVGRLLDVGCGEGWFLKTAQGQGWEVTGIDISDTMCSYIRNCLGLNVFQKELCQANFPSSYFDVIRLSDIVEHIQDPKGLLLESNRILKMGGLVVVRFPNPKPLMASFMGLVNKIRGVNILWSGTLDPPYHLYGFPLKAMKRLLKDTGFKILCYENIIDDYSACDSGIDAVAISQGQKRKRPLKSKIKLAILKAIGNIAKISNAGEAFAIFAIKHKAL